MAEDRVNWAIERYSIVRYIHQRIHKRNKNFICAITGPTGSGKSWTGLSIAEMLDPEFNVDRVVFKAEELMKLVNSGSLKSGSVILWDEAGIDLSNRNWQSMMNKMLNFLLQTFRHKNFILLFTVPYSDFLDKASRKLLHGEFETQGINNTYNTTNLKPKLLQYNANMGKWYAKYLVTKKEGNGKIKVKRWKVPKPTDELINSYEKKKTAFTNSLNFDIEAAIRKQAEEKAPTKKLGETQEKVLALWKKGIFIQKEIAKELGVSQATISQSVEGLRKKGYFVEQYRDKHKNNQEG